MQFTYNLSTLWLLTLVGVTLLFSSTTLIAEDKTGKTDVPFGIRHYDKGPAENFSLKDIDGESHQLTDSRGQWVFLHFWASWCGPCKEEMPAIQQLSDMIGEDKLQIVMVNTAEDADTVFEFLAAIGVELNSLLDRDGQVTEIWKPRGLPTTFLISPKGDIKYQAIGGREWHKPEYINFLNNL